MAEFSHALNLRSHGRFYFFHVNHALLAMPGFKELYTHLYTIIHNKGRPSVARESPHATTSVLFFYFHHFFVFSCIYFYHKAGSNSVPSYCTGVT